MTREDFLKIPSFQEKMANKIWNGIRNKKGITLSKIMAGSCIFGFGISVKKFDLLLENIDIFREYDEKEFIEKVNHIKGFSDKTSKKIWDKLEEFKEFYGVVKRYFILKEIEKREGKFKDVVCVFSGFRDSALKMKIESKYIFY